MGGPLFVNVDPEGRILAREGPARSRVVDVNVGQQERGDVAGAISSLGQAGVQSGQSDRGTGIHHDRAVAGLDQIGRQRFGAAHVLEVDQGEPDIAGGHILYIRTPTLLDHVQIPWWPCRARRDRRAFLRVASLTFGKVSETVKLKVRIAEGIETR